MSNPRASLIDVSGIFYQHYHSSEHDDVSKAMERTMRDVRRCAEGADYVACCLDTRGKTFRHEIAESYKAQRETRPEALYEQLRKTEEALQRRYHCFSCSGWEADDVIATLCAWLQDAIPGVAITVHSADKDTCQLVNDSVMVVSTKTGVEFTKKAVLERFGVAPHEVAHFQAIAGDSSDNIKGVPGIGPKHAATLIGKFGFIEGVVDAVKNHPTLLDDIAGIGTAKKTALREAVLDGSLERALQLTTLASNVPIDCERILTTKEQEDDPMPSEPFGAQLDSEPPPAEPTQPSTPKPEVFEAEPVSSATTATVSQMKPTAALARIGGGFSTELEPRDLKSATWLADVIFKSRMFEAYGTPQAALLTIMAGREHGLGAMASLRGFHIVEGKPTMSAQMMMALCLGSSLCKTFRVRKAKCSADIAVVEVCRRDWDEPEFYEWTMKDAERAGLTGRNVWKKHGPQMLINRAIAEAARFTFPELMAGVYTPDEINPDYAEVA